MTSTVIYKKCCNKYCTSMSSTWISRKYLVFISCPQSRTQSCLQLSNKADKNKLYYGFVYLVLFQWGCKLVHNSFKQSFWKEYIFSFWKEWIEAFRFKKKLCLPFCLNQGDNSYNHKIVWKLYGKLPKAKSLHISASRKKVMSDHFHLPADHFLHLPMNTLSFHSISKHMFFAD